MLYPQWESITAIEAVKSNLIALEVKGISTMETIMGW